MHQRAIAQFLILKQKNSTDVFQTSLFHFYETTTNYHSFFIPTPRLSSKMDRISANGFLAIQIARCEWTCFFKADGGGIREWIFRFSGLWKICFSRSME